MFFLSSFTFRLYKKQIPKILIASFLKSIHLIPQTAPWSFFSTPIPAILHLVVFDFNPEKSEIDRNFSEK